MKHIVARARGRLGPGQRRWRSLSVAACLAVLAAGAGSSLPVAMAASGGGGLSGTTTTPGTTTTTTPTTTTPPPRPIPAAGGRFLRGRGMWIWELGSTNSGNVSSIIAQAHYYGLSTLLIKSSDGTGMWSQFSPTLVRQLHHAHLHVCAWQYVYGSHPQLEAQAGAQAVRDGANCLIIDAEVEYQGKYIQAQTYIRTLRKLIGYRFPVGLAGFPWIDYHPSFPYSVFLGPGGAQLNVPQMYWHDIGTTVDNVYAHTYDWNELYKRPIFPLGQLYANPPLRQVKRFREIGRAYRATGLSWWDWQSAGPAQFAAAAQPVGRIRGYVPRTTVVTVSQGSQGDWVVWAQEHLLSAGESVSIDGDFGPKTELAVQNFQAAHKLPVTGVLDPVTWGALLRYKTARVTWVRRNHQLQATVTRNGTRIEAVPRSASLPERRDEIAGAGGAGRPRR